MSARAVGWGVGVIILMLAAPSHAAFWWEGLGPFVKPGIVIVPSPCRGECADGNAPAPGARGAAEDARRQLEYDIEREIERVIGDTSPSLPAGRERFR